MLYLKGAVMSKNSSSYKWSRLVVAGCLLAIGLAGCGSGDNGAPGAPGAPGPGVAPLAGSTALNFTITSVTIGSPPVVNFSVTNQDGVAVAGFAETDLRFNIAKLIPGTPTKWQSYIYRNQASSAHQANQERKSTSTGYRFGTLVDHKNGTFTYTFATDITNPADVVCPAPCTDAEGVALDLSYQPTLTHRVAIQQGNNTLPKANAIYDFVPAGGAVSTMREIVKTSNCNECHNQLTVHGSRIETKLCVTCHNPGSWVAGTPGVTPNTPVDFKVMIHKIHQGEELPSVKAGTPYKIGSADFSTVVFPYSAVALGDTRACAKCHTNSATGPDVGRNTSQGDNWKTQPSKAACAACHDDVYFGDTPDLLKPYQTVRHMTLISDAGGVPVENPADSLCINCHSTGQLAGSVEAKHDLPNLLKAEGLKYVFNIRSITNSGPGLVPVITFSVDNASGTPYDIKTGAQFLDSNASLSLLVGWNNIDENNTGSGSYPGQPFNINLKGANAVCDAGTFICTVNMGANTIPLGATGSGRAAIYGRVGVDVDGDATVDRVRVKAAFKDFAITDSTPVARRQVVDINKCDKCHDQVSLHGDSRTNEPGLCVLCHNPSATDVNRRPKIASGPGTGFPDGSVTLDKKTEEAIDFKRLIHGVHAAAKTLYPVAPATVGAAGHGFRNKGLVVYGYNSSVNDFSHVRFPGILNDCTTCHLTGTYELAGKWEVPTASGILGSTVKATPDPTGAIGTYAQQLASQTDDLNITPTAAVCTACHDGDVAKSHMVLNGAQFELTQDAINTSPILEACAICHGPGRIADVKLIHGVK
jgi:OmcA/MtrC family decaheme c-type cytochrome